MNVNRTVIKSMVITAIVMIGLTGFAMAGSSTDYYVGDGAYDTNFNGYGIGDLTIYTSTSYGNDVQHVEWSNTRVNGWQEMDTGSMSTVIDRKTTVGKYGTGQDASGSIFVQSTDNAPTGGDTLKAVADYKDDEAYTSHVTLKQTVLMVDNGAGFEGVGARTLIKGHAYGADTYVGGYVAATSDGHNNVTVFATIGMDEGKFRMKTYTGSMDSQSGLEASGMYIRNMKGVGDGTAAIGAYSTDDATAGWDNTIQNDAMTRYNYDDGFYGNPVSVTFTDDFNTNYQATGYIYVFNP